MLEYMVPLAGPASVMLNSIYAAQAEQGFIFRNWEVSTDGNQPVDGGVYGKSITDPCIGWEKTERLVLEIADRA